jgi:putative heme-binding domain-containing protein
MTLSNSSVVPRSIPRLLWLLAFLLHSLAFAQDPKWIWQSATNDPSQPDQVRFFRRHFSADAKLSKALLSVAADAEATVYVNGKQVARSRELVKPAYEDVTSEVKPGENVLAVRCRSLESRHPAVLAILELRQAGKPAQRILSDGAWRSSNMDQPGWRTLTFDDSNWSPAVVLGTLGDERWGNVLKEPKATPAESLTVLPGFKVELIHSAGIGEGSWICMTVDSRGRLIISPQADNQPLLRVTLGGGGKVTQIEPIPAPVHQAMGLLYAHKSLYVDGHGPNGTGLYRLIDSNHNDQFETNEVHFLKRFQGEGEHGYHAVVEGPDHMIYVMNGNHTKVPDGIAPDSPHKNYGEDFLLQREWDPGGHAVGILAPGGYVVRTDPEGKKWELMLAGFRNSYDFDFSPEGEMFTFDSDMEWDWGLPWYRPIRILHCVQAADFGWRSGSADWPIYYPDTLPPVVNVGIGSPTGMKFGTRSNYPERYRKALYAFDWSYGRIFAVHLKPDGSSYTGDFEAFLKGKPLNLTDLEFGKDGAMYFITGGRGTQSGLYRVSYVGGVKRHDPHLDPAVERTAARARRLRHKLEALQGHQDPKTLDIAWPYLASDDTFIRNAARIAVEWQEVGLWKDRALAETNVTAGLTALMSLARCSGRETQRDLLMALKKFPLDSLSVTQQLHKLRVIELSFIRHGRPEPDLAKLAIEKLDRIYPSANEYVNRELSQLLIYLEAPGVVGKTLALLDKARTQEEQVHYVFYLRNLTNGWTLDQRRHYFDWFRFAEEEGEGQVTYPQGSAYSVWSNQQKAAERHDPELLAWFRAADRDYGDGASYPKYISNMRKQAIDALSQTDRKALGSLAAEDIHVASFKLTRERKFTQEWKITDLEPQLGEVSHARNFENGKAAFNDGQCILCHRMGNRGGSVGPELTAASSKYSRREILESMIDPSKVISDQYQNYTVTRKNGEAETGRIVDENDARIVVRPNPLGSERVDIPKSDIAKREPSKISPMPAALLDQFTKEDVLDLLAYIDSGGKADAANFKK